MFRCSFSNRRKRTKNTRCPAPYKMQVLVDILQLACGSNKSKYYPAKTASYKQGKGSRNGQTGKTALKFLFIFPIQPPKIL